MAARTAATAADCCCRSSARYATDDAEWTFRRELSDADASVRSACHAARGAAARRTITRVDPRPAAAGTTILPARTRGSEASPVARRIGVKAAEAEVAAANPIATARSSGLRKAPHTSRSRIASRAMFKGKRALVLGVANKRSIAWAIARRL